MIRPQQVSNNIQYPTVQNITPVIYNNPNINTIKVVNSNQNSFYRYNNVQNIIPFPTVRSSNSNNKSNYFAYRNLIPINNGFQFLNNNVIPNPGKRFIKNNFNIQTQRPILRSNSANNYSFSRFGNGAGNRRIINFPIYRPLVYKRELY